MPYSNTYIVEHLHSGHSVKQPPHYYRHLLRLLVIYIMAYSCTSIKQPPLYYNHNLGPWATTMGRFHCISSRKVLKQATSLPPSWLATHFLN